MKGTRTAGGTQVGRGVGLTWCSTFFCEEFAVGSADGILMCEAHGEEYSHVNEKPFKPYARLREAHAKPKVKAKAKEKSKYVQQHPTYFCEAPQARIPRWASLPMLVDGSLEGLIDTAVMYGLLMGKLDFAKAGKSKVYFTINRNLSQIAKWVHKRPDTVRTSLERLQAQHRIYMPIAPSRGRNGTLIHIGVQTHVLFAPVLTPQRLWNLSMERYWKAVEKKGASIMREEIGRLGRHLSRFADGDEDKARLATSLDEIRQKVGIA
jgi:hypothetical protein